MNTRCIAYPDEVREDLLELEKMVVTI